MSEDTHPEAKALSIEPFSPVMSLITTQSQGELVVSLCAEHVRARRGALRPAEGLEEDYWEVSL